MSGILALSCCCGVPALADPAGQVWVMYGDMQSANEPMERLANTLQKDKKSRFFRLAWGTGLTSFQDGATVLYDRKRHLLKFYSTESYRTDNDEGPVKWTQASELIWYRGVTDRILFKPAAKNRKADSSDVDAFVNELPQFGCRKKRIFSRSTTKTLKN